MDMFLLIAAVALVIAVGALTRVGGRHGVAVDETIEGQSLASSSDFGPVIAYGAVAALLATVLVAASWANSRSDSVSQADFDVLNFSNAQANRSVATADHDQKWGFPKLNSEDGGCLRTVSVSTEMTWTLVDSTLNGPLEEVIEHSLSRKRLTGQAFRACAPGVAGISAEFGRFFDNDTSVVVRDAQGQEYRQEPTDHATQAAGTWHRLSVDDLSSGVTVHLIRIYPHLNADNEFDVAIYYSDSRPLGPTMVYLNPFDYGEEWLESYEMRVIWPRHYVLTRERSFVFPRRVRESEQYGPDILPDNLVITFDSIETTLIIKSRKPIVEPINVHYRVLRTLPESN